MLLIVDTEDKETIILGEYSIDWMESKTHYKGSHVYAWDSFKTYKS